MTDTRDDVRSLGSGRGPWLLFAAVGLGMHALLAGGALDTWPQGLRVLLAGVVLLLVPGAAFIRMGLVPPGGPLFAAGWGLGFGVAWNAAIVLIARALGHPVSGLESITLWVSLGLWIAAFLAPRRASPPDIGRPGRVALTLALLASVAAGLYVGRLGPVNTYPSDSPDHVGTIRRIVTSGDAFPTDAFFRDAGPNGVDPRKGVWHPQVGIVSRLADVDPHVAWTWLPVLLAPLFVLNVGVLGLLVGGGAGAAVVGWALLLTFGGTIDQMPLRQAAFSSRLADQLAFAATAAVLTDLVRPAWQWRVAAMLLGFAAVTSHLFAVITLAVPLGALGVALLVRDRGVGPDFRRLLGTSLALAAAALPFLLWRARQAYAPGNEIHTESQGLLYLTGGWHVMSPGFLWTAFSWAWVLIPVLWVPLWRDGRDRPATLWMLAGTIAAALMTLNPLFVALLEPRVGYLIPRFLGFVPMAVLLAWAVPWAWGLAAGGPHRRRGRLTLALIGITLIPAFRDAITLVPHPELTERVEARSDVKRWGAALDWMREHLPEDAIVLSDPVTSYSIPMMAGRYVVTLVDQHSSPNDPFALDRLLDARDALDAHSSWDRLRAVVDHYGATVIALNNRFFEPPYLDYWGPTPEWFAAARERLDQHPDAFRNVYDTGDFVIYEVNRAALDLIDHPVPPRPHVERWSPDLFPPGRSLAPDMPAIHGVRLARSVFSPGDTLDTIALWRAPVRMRAGSYSVAVRLDRPLPDGLQPPAFLSKPWRKLLEKLRGERYRIRSNHLPAGGAYGVDRWRPDEVVLDPFRMPIPLDAAPGEYALRIRMMRQPHYPNYHLSDWFFDEDLFSGITVAHVRIEPRGTNDVRH